MHLILLRARCSLEASLRIHRTYLQLPNPRSNVFHTTKTSVQCRKLHLFDMKYQSHIFFNINDKSNFFNLSIHNSFDQNAISDFLAADPPLENLPPEQLSVRLDEVTTLPFFPCSKCRLVHFSFFLIRAWLKTRHNTMPVMHSRKRKALVSCVVILCRHAISVTLAVLDERRGIHDSDGGDFYSAKASYIIYEEKWFTFSLLLLPAHAR